VGRVEFNPARVRTHFIHTIMRLELETNQQIDMVDLSHLTTACLLAPPTSSHEASLVDLQYTFRDDNYTGEFRLVLLQRDCRVRSTLETIFRLVANL
jgi:hypothetical protein